METWKDIPDYKDIYQASDWGRIRSLDRLDSIGRKRKGKILIPTKGPAGYIQLHLCNGKRKLHKVHKLVLESFIGPVPDEMNACHNNNKRDDNRLENLRWDTKSNNELDKKKHGTDPSTTHNKSVLCVETGRIFNSIREATRQTGIPEGNISRVCRGKRKSAGGFHWEYI